MSFTHYCKNILAKNFANSCFICISCNGGLIQLHYLYREEFPSLKPFSANKWSASVDETLLGTIPLTPFLVLKGSFSVICE